MADALSPDQLAAIKARCEAATRREGGRASELLIAVGVFAATARDDIPALLQHIDSQAAELAALRKANTRNDADARFIESCYEDDSAANAARQVSPTVERSSIVDSIPVPASVLAAVGEAFPAVLATCAADDEHSVYCSSRESGNCDCYQPTIQAAKAALDKLKPYLPASNSPRNLDSSQVSK